MADEPMKGITMTEEFGNAFVSLTHRHDQEAKTWSTEFTAGYRYAMLEMAKAMEPAALAELWSKGFIK